MEQNFPSDHIKTFRELNENISYKLHKFNTPGTRGGPGGRDPTLAAKRRKNAGKSVFFHKKKLKKKKIAYIYWSFPEVGQKQKTEKKKERRENERW